ncbi:VanZ family protein [Clostridium sp. CS001]|uniref:VanZ family protein n=1 Tax=Clostridium sp. CS001 TaxID=2880648 RepID=UPI001CF2E7BB|nr:VanZ family protein [Clostridium sp. CS001]MCB2289981.1 VanZ family protein [Clostridium sp. CS001]
MKNFLKGKTIIIGLLCVAWLAVIFYNGTRQGEVSQKSSKEIVKVISRFINISPATMERASIKFSNANYYVRKNAHFFQYLILSILICSVARQLKLCKSTQIFLVLFLLLFFSVADEFIQGYIPGRTSNVFDIIIDFSGGVLGMLIFSFKIRSRKRYLKTERYF